MEIDKEIERLLKISVDEKASDLHLVPRLPPTLRVDGDLVAVKDAAPLSSEIIKRLIDSIMTPDQQQDFEKTLECDMALAVSNIGNFRVNVRHQLWGIGAAFRIIPEEVPPFEKLGLPSTLKPLLSLSHGMILVTGATGCGKSTTLAAMVDYINTMRICNIITIEDPIEFIYKNKKSLITQRQVRRDTHDISVALRSALRQDPDVILLGEMRDLESIRLALMAAETGHLVLTTLHASSAPLSIGRIVDVFPQEEKNRVRNLLAETVQAVICQTLVRKTAGGRIPAFEIMLAVPAIRHLIREDKISHMTMTIQTSGNLGMCTMDQYLQGLVAKNIITSAVARSIASSQEWFSGAV
ncbi:MAG: twitching motility protein PilT [Gammaproteobacteria bacterium RIFCSPHIGHO2_12_FULL_37_34]|nr:MAG: twitching motility protein PilT [Gammaproteobacteria bacterium RIFCSPHIGHO2_12_FULL_37_34]